MLPAFFFTTSGKSEGLEDPKFVTTLASECVPVATKFKSFSSSLVPSILFRSVSCYQRVNVCKDKEWKIWRGGSGFFQLFPLLEWQLDLTSLLGNKLGPLPSRFLWGGRKCCRNCQACPPPSLQWSLRWSQGLVRLAVETARKTNQPRDAATLLQQAFYGLFPPLLLSALERGHCLVHTQAHWSMGSFLSLGPRVGGYAYVRSSFKNIDTPSSRPLWPRWFTCFGETRV